ncbi:hypothetical protein A2U01_0106121, partial [Trifolium medium]|nr:hypothetical protein [Trifolium medium]
RVGSTHTVCSSATPLLTRGCRLLAGYCRLQTLKCNIDAAIFSLEQKVSMALVYATNSVSL